GFMGRVGVGSLGAYIISEMPDVYVYWFIRGIFACDGAVWMGNGGSRMISQVVDRVIFRTIGFLGRYRSEVWIE
ncbi:VUT family protein, partial [Bacillus pumilus]|uniref:VUT family protein n=1 Tax=Bacillus pumilus TaxID=1408 RepID=UPI00164303AD